MRSFTRQDIACAICMGMHARLGAGSPLQVLSDAGCDVMAEIFRLVPVVLPDDARTLREAIGMASPGGSVLCRAGEHVVGARPGQEVVPGKNESGETFLVVENNITIMGEEGALLRHRLALCDLRGRYRGMLVLRAERGAIVGLTIQDAGDCCVKVEKGNWSIIGCFLLCGHACAMRAEQQANVYVRSCRLGGEGKIGKAVAEYYDLPRQWIDTAGSLQEYGLQKNACYGVFVRDEASVVADRTEISYCSESALFLRDSGAAVMHSCRVANSVTAFTSGWGFGRALEVSGCDMTGVTRLWYDDDRPIATCMDGFTTTQAA